MINLKRILPPEVRTKLMYALRWMPDKPYLKLFYWATTGKKLDLENPKGFNEKVNWLKLHDIHPEYSQLVDKVYVRDHITRIWGGDHLFPLLGKWKSFDDIDFKMLPNEFVLKCNHDSGSVKIIRDKSSLTSSDIKHLSKFYHQRLKDNFYWAGREYSYRGIEQRYIIAEKLMKDEEHPEKNIEDFKFYCFDGEPRMMLIVTDRASDCRFDFFDMDFVHLDIYRHRPNADKQIEKPQYFDEMKYIVKQLSTGIKCVRIDLYQLNGKIYFGEYTFFPGGGFELFHPPEWEQRLGDWIHIEGV